MKYTVKGESIFVYEDRELHLYRKEYTEEWQKMFQEKEVYDLFQGKEFLEHVRKKLIISYDGSIANVFVDGYDSNLGLFTKSFEGGNFLVDDKTFEILCEKHEIFVNWANK